GSDEIADSPAGHRVRLRGAVDRDDAAVLVDRGGTPVRALEDDLLVDLVADEIEVVRGRDLQYPLERLPRPDRARRIPWAVHAHRLRPRGARGAPQLVEIGPGGGFGP